MEQPLWFFHFSRSAVPSSSQKGTWTRRVFHPVKYAGWNYRMQFNRFFDVQPEGQSIIQPGGPGPIPDAFVLGAQIGVIF
jgi:carbohydrate-selective porin OprB